MTAAPTPPGATPPGWYPAPDRPNMQRYWDGATWTTNYAPMTGQPQGEQRVAHGFSIASLVLGLCGVLFFIFYAVVPILAIIFGAIAINRQQKAGVRRDGMAVAGLVLGIATTALFVVLLIIGVTAEVNS